MALADRAVRSGGASKQAQLCDNRCNRPALAGSRYCAECVVGDVPLVRPGLLPSDYLEACALELAARGAQQGNRQHSERAEQLWRRVVAATSTFLFTGFYTGRA